MNKIDRTHLEQLQAMRFPIKMSGAMNEREIIRLAEDSGVPYHLHPMEAHKIAESNEEEFSKVYPAFMVSFILEEHCDVLYHQALLASFDPDMVIMNSTNTILLIPYELNIYMVEHVQGWELEAVRASEDLDILFMYIDQYSEALVSAAYGEDIEAYLLDMMIAAYGGQVLIRVLSILEGRFN